MPSEIERDALRVIAMARHSEACDGGYSLVGVAAAEASLLALRNAGVAVVRAGRIETLEAQLATVTRERDEALNNAIAECVAVLSKPGPDDIRTRMLRIKCIDALRSLNGGNHE